MLAAIASRRIFRSDQGQRNAIQSDSVRSDPRPQRHAVRDVEERKPSRCGRWQLLRVGPGSVCTHHLPISLFRFTDSAGAHCYGARVMAEPSPRKLAGIALILLLIVAWATFVASMARVVGGWPILVQAPFYLFMGIIWIIPLKPLIRWIQSGSFKARSPKH